MTEEKLSPAQKPGIVTEAQIWEKLKTIIDPELAIDIVSLGLVYEVHVREVQMALGPASQVQIVMTLTTPGCPLAHVFEKMIKDALCEIPGFLAYQQTVLELTFDPPWIPDMMTEAARAELGF